MSGLFRKQVVERQSDRLHGEVLLLPRSSHLMILALLVLWVSMAMTWLTSSNYARKETAAGWLEPSTGVLRVYAERAGVIKQVLTKEGEYVVKDQPLFVVNGDHILDDGNSLESLLIAEYEGQRQLLAEQQERGSRIHRKQLKDIEQKIAATQSDLDLLEKQLATHGQRTALIKEQAERYRQLKQAGYISSAELDAVVAKELELQATLQSLERSRINLRSQIQQLENKRSLLPEEYANNNDQLGARLSDLAQQIAELHGRRAYIVKAPRSGIVSNMQAREGLKARSGIPMLSLIPEDYELTAQLLVPVQAAGLIEAGQALNIRYDSFPYQKFGLHGGDVSTVSDTVLLPDELLNAPVTVREPVFRVSATLKQTSIQAYGKELSLKPGMTLSADVELSERTLLQWLLEPIFSLNGRL